MRMRLRRREGGSLCLRRPSKAALRVLRRVQRTERRQDLPGVQEQGQKGGRAPLQCMEPLLQNGNPTNEVGTGNGMLTIFHSIILEDESRKILEKERLSDAEEDRGGPEPSSLGSHQLGFATIQLPEYFGDDHPVHPISESNLKCELADQPVLQGPAEVYSRSTAGKEAKKNWTGRTPSATSLKAAPPGDPLGLEQVQTGNQKLSLGPGTCPSAQRTTALSTCPQPGKLPSSQGSTQGSMDGQDGAKKREGPPEPPEEPPPLPARKKTRTFYSSEQLEELERMFLEDHYPDSEKRREIAAAVGVTPQRVMVWFQNRRAKWRKMEKLTMGTKKCSAPAPGACQVSGLPHSTQGAPLLPKPAPSNMGQDQPSTVEMPLPSGLLPGQPALLASTSVGSVTGRGTLYEAVPTKAVSQDLFPAVSSPPPIRRASLPLSVAFNPNNHMVPLDAPSSEYSPSSSQESSSSEVLTYSSQSQSSSSPMQCSYPEQLEPTANLETPYYHPANQYSQPQAPPLYHFPIHLTSSVLSGVCLTSTTPSKSSNALFSLPGNGGLTAYPQEGSVIPYLQNNVGGQLLIQPSAGNSGYVPALQAVPWNEFYLQGAPVSNQPCTQVQFSTCGGGSYSAEQMPYAQKPCATSSACLLQMPRVTLPGSTLLFTAKQAVPAESHLNPDHHSLEEHTEPSERDSDTNNSLKEEENADDFSAESKN